MQKDQIPEITKLLKETTVSVCEWATDRPQILVQISRIIQEVCRTGIGKELEEHVGALGMTVFEIYQQGFRFRRLKRFYLRQRIKGILRALNKGELLDQLHELAVLAHMDEIFDNLAELNLPFPVLGQGPKTPPSALQDLSLPERHPDATVFVTSQYVFMLYSAIPLFFVQLAIYLYPCGILLVTLFFKLMATKYDSSITIIIDHFLGIHLLLGRSLFNERYQLHPNIFRGLQAARELILFRLWHWFPGVNPLVEPFILSFPTSNTMKVDIPSRLDSMKKGSLFPLYWLPLTPKGVAAPVPCYAAMRELVIKWKDGRLPRQAWGHGWWELRVEKENKWQRANVNFCPTWSEYSKASKEIKVSTEVILHDVQHSTPSPHG
jgi:hypothetical protein